MSDYDSNRGQRRSHEVITPLLILAGVIGIPAALGIAQCSREDDQPPTVSSTQSYPNNYYLPGAGYYHAPFHAWFPFAYNSYENGRGWFRGGQWRPTATEDPSEWNNFPRGGSGAGFASGQRVSESRPSMEAVASANAAAATHFSSVSRGGFGGSAQSGAS